MTSMSLMNYWRSEAACDPLPRIFSLCSDDVHEWTQKCADYTTLHGASHFICKNCFFPRIYWHGVPYVVHDSGWWDVVDGYCYCKFFDRAGCELSTGTRILTNCHILQNIVDDLEVDYVVSLTFVKYTSRHDDISDDNGPRLTAADIVSVEAFRRLRALSRYFIHSTLPALRRCRSCSRIMTCLPLVILRRCRCCCSSLRQWGFKEAASVDITFIRVCGLQWIPIVRSFTINMMQNWDPHYKETVCYLPIGSLVRLSDAPYGIDARGWAWVCFQKPYDGKAVRAGWVHPDIFEKPTSQHTFENSRN